MTKKPEAAIKTGDVVLLAELDGNSVTDLITIGVVEEGFYDNGLIKITVSDYLEYYINPDTRISKFGGWKIVENLGPLEDKPASKPPVFQYQIMYSRTQADKFMPIGKPYDNWTEAHTEATTRYNRYKTYGFQYQIIDYNNENLLWSSEQSMNQLPGLVKEQTRAGIKDTIKRLLARTQEIDDATGILIKGLTEIKLEIDSL